MSFEALSRGAARARLVEKSSVSIGLIKDNAELLGVKENIEVIHSDVFDYSENVSPDIFFAGPPYGENLSATILVHAREKKILTPDTLVIIQHHKKDLPGSIGYERIDYREYGITALSFFRLL